MLTAQHHDRDVSSRNKKHGVTCDNGGGININSVAIAIAYGMYAAAWQTRQRRMPTWRSVNAIIMRISSCSITRQHSRNSIKNNGAAWHQWRQRQHQRKRSGSISVKKA